MKMVNETRKILGDDSLRITATTVRVPVFNSHSESINLEFEMPDDAEAAKAIEQLNGAEYVGRSMVVKEALPKDRKSVV